MSTKIYSYGASAPTEGLDRVRAQMRLAHRYRNILVSLERKKRRRVQDATYRVSPELWKLDEYIEKRQADREAIREEINVARAKARKRVQLPELSDQVNAIKTELKGLYADQKKLKKQVFKSDEWLSEQTWIDEWNYPKKKRLYNAVSACGLYWGTILQVDDSMKNAHKGAPPEFRRWNGRGKIAVQVQKGMSVMQLLGCEDTRVRVLRGAVLRPSKRDDTIHGGPRKGLPTLVHPERKLGDATAFLRIGSNGRKPIFAEVPIHFHRELPATARVKWAWLLVGRLGHEEKWKLQFVLTDVPTESDHAQTGAVGIDVGWRIMDGGTPERRLRVAMWIGSNGERAELSLSGGWLSQMRKVEDIRSIRDKEFDKAREQLARWVKARTVPAWLAEEATTIHLWKSPMRLAGLVVRWRREAKFDGSDTEYDLLETWRKRDDHLLLYEANLRDQLQGSRMDHYRKFAAAMRRKYGSIFAEDMDLRDFHEDVEIEDDEDEKTAIRKKHVRDACLSSLLQCLRESGSRTVPAEWTTRDCGNCGFRNEWEDQSLLMLKCEGCGETWDQDLNGCKNILRLGFASDSKVTQDA